MPLIKPTFATLPSWQLKHAIIAKVGSDELLEMPALAGIETTARLLKSPKATVRP
jgi:hypothetical protein